MNDELVLADAMREAALNENAGAAEAGFCDVWRMRAATAIDVRTPLNIVLQLSKYGD